MTTSRVKSVVWKVAPLGALYALLFALLMLASPVKAQTPARTQPPQTITLEQAISLARQNNPDFLQQRNNVDEAEWQVREAFGQLLPGAGVNTSFSYQGAGTPRFGFFTGSDLGLSSTPAYLSSDYNIGLTYSLSGATLFGPARARSNKTAVVAQTEAAEFQLASAVTQGYLAVLSAQDAVTLARQEQERATENLKLANARVTVGAAIPLEAKQAEVDKGRTDVALLQAQNDLKTAKLRLMQQLGLELGRDVELTSQFAVTQLSVSEADLVRKAMSLHPNLRAFRAAEDAAAAGEKAARTQYLPTIDVQAGWSGYTRQAQDDAYIVGQLRDNLAGKFESCQQLNAISAGLQTPLSGYPQDCSKYVFTPTMEQAALSGNRVFPFSYTSQPFSALVRVSLPVFNGFTRQRSLEQAKVARQDANLRVRAEELRLKAEVAAAYETMETSRLSVGLEERNREVADEQLKLARERYRVGAASFLELRDAETIKARADRAYLTALYNYHQSLAALENATGQTLHTATTR